MIQVDFGVVLITFVCVIVANAASDQELAQKFSLLTALRFVRLVRLIRLFTEKKQLETAARQLVSQNKRRYQVIRLLFFRLQVILPKVSWPKVIYFTSSHLTNMHFAKSFRPKLFCRKPFGRLFHLPIVA